MVQDYTTILKSRLSEQALLKLNRINNVKVHEFIAEYLELCNPDSVFVCTDTPEDLQYIRDSAIRNHEEAKLATPGKTVHFDGYFDQARDKQKTKFLIPKGIDLGPEINSVDRDSGLAEIRDILKNIMQGHEVNIKFFCLGPTNSEFSIPCVQLTDSSYVSHCEDLLYRQGYQEIIKLGEGARFFKFVHSEGALQEAGLGLRVSKNIEQRRIYIDLQNEIIYSANTQYGGNTIGLKKLAMRLAINRASKEGWLTEHMLLMGVHGPNDRLSYFTGAFPSMCGKTSTAMMDGENIVGDDIAYLKKINGKICGVNVEKGIFGIIEGINSTDDPAQWRALNSENEMILSNILVTKDNIPFWNGKDKCCPDTGCNHSGDWQEGTKDPNGKDITPSHKNARFTIDLGILENLDPRLHDPNGIEVSGIIYGGRDSDTWVPVEEAFSWEHGIITKGAALESETTAATLGQEGVRVFNPMSNLDFLSIPIGRYIEDNLKFGTGMEDPPRIYSVNYFLKGPDGNFLNHKNDKRIWLKWMELRVHNDVEAINTPTGFIPYYDDLKRLFQEVQNKEYTLEDYNQQFTHRIPENLTKIERIIEIYKTRVLDTPESVYKVLSAQRERLTQARADYGEYIKPDMF
jgi:phosphoenolpyruvate carboxykinase (GTP)